ncbi:MAG: 4Fe-4S dicluster domain-containing protein [Candidatus Helarchaeales archaeon]
MTISSAFRKELSESEIGKTINYCYQCGTCTGICPAARFTRVFNPRKIVENALLGFKDKILDDPVLWNCTTCHSCLEVCPQSVLVSEIMFELRNLSVERGHLPEVFRAEGEGFYNTGLNIPSSPAIARRRKQLGLEENITKPKVEDFRKICEITGFAQLVQKKPESSQEEAK